MEMNEMINIQNLLVDMLPMVHLNDEEGPAHVQLTLINLSYDARQIVKHTIMGKLQMFADYCKL